MEFILWIELVLEAIPMVLIKSIFLCFLLLLILKMRKYKITPSWIVFLGLLIIYLNLLYEATFGINGGITLVENRLSPDLIPHGIPDSQLLQTALNVVLFLPLGFLLPLVLKKTNTFFRICLISFVFSLFIETLQYFTGRSMDINDMICNTVGSCFGYLIQKGIRKIYPLLQKYIFPTSSSTTKR